MARAVSGLPLGSKIQIPIVPEHRNILGDFLVFRVVDKNHAGYPSNSVTLMMDSVFDNLPFDAREPNNPSKAYVDSGTGYRWYYYRSLAGNNRYIHSNAHKWMNSAVSNWYSAAHAYDMPPSSDYIHAGATAYAGWPGLLKMLEPFFTANILNTNISVYKNQQDGYGSESVSTKIFLPSHSEMGFQPDTSWFSYSLGTAFAYGSSSDSARIAYKRLSPSEKSSYYLRSIPGRADYTSDESIGINAERVGSVSDGGTFVSKDAYGNYAILPLGLRPVTNIKNDTIVTDTTNASGYYELIEPTPSAPTISYPQSGKKIYNAKPRFLLTINDSFQNLNPQEITAAGFDASTATGLMKNRRIILQKSTPATPGNVALSATTKTRLSTPSTAVSRTATYEAPTFTDNPIRQNTTRIKAAHMNELRTMINDTRQYYGLAPIVWNETIEAGTTSTRNWAAHIEEMRNAINDIVTLVNSWDTSAALRIVLPAWIPISTGRPRADVMEQIRAAVQLL